MVDWSNFFKQSGASNAMTLYQETFGSIDFDWGRITQLPDFDEREDEYVQMILKAVKDKKRISNEDFGLDEMPEDFDY